MNDSKNNQQDLMLEAVNQAAQHGSELQRLCGGLSQLLRAGRQEEAMDQLRLLLNGLGAIAQAVHLTTPLQERAGSSIDLQDLSEMLRPIVGALENRDYVLLADLIQYEVHPLLANWTAELQAISHGCSA
ncbi:MAG: hypothetical protein Kow00109_09900 [Acidobacteriota bacterium]